MSHPSNADSPKPIRTVSDILWVDAAPLAFVEARQNRPDIDQQGQYVAVCPWCTKDLGVIDAGTYGDLASELYALTAEHVAGEFADCPERDNTTLRVQLKGSN